MMRVSRSMFVALFVACIGCGGSAPAQTDARPGGLGSDAQAVTGSPVVQSGSRLKVKVYKSDDGMQLPIPGTAYDSQLGVDCSFRTADDGVMRCIPTAATAGFYADAACTVPAAQWYVCATGLPAYAVGTHQSSTCSDQIYTVSAITGAQLANGYQKSGTSCTAAPTMLGGVLYFAYYAVGSVVPPSTFAPVTYTTAM